MKTIISKALWLLYKVIVCIKINQTILLVGYVQLGYVLYIVYLLVSLVYCRCSVEIRLVCVHRDKSSQTWESYYKRRWETLEDISRNFEKRRQRLLLDTSWNSSYFRFTFRFSETAGFGVNTLNSTSWNLVSFSVGHWGSWFKNTENLVLL